ncbi:unnamed protein product [Euphydryas editha]|uniref:Uncharacterized protein n=1 Tax=Euphydryas editha TaxID=104508 RepID=A0AAU9V4B9_EUPED|nr:unnamed protein product [Euphydryas editha]
MDVSTGGVSHDSGKLVRGGGAPRHPGSRGLSDSGGEKLLLNGRARRERGWGGRGRRCHVGQAFIRRNACCTSFMVQL